MQNKTTFMQLASQNGNRRYPAGDKLVSPSPYYSSSYAAMYRNNPLQNTIELNDRVSPLVNSRLYATTDGRQLNQLIVHGASNTLIPQMTTTNLQDLEDKSRSGLAGEVSMHYNYNLYDKERDL